MIILIAIAVIILLLAIRGFYDRARERERGREELKKCYGSFSQRSYGTDEFERIRASLDTVKSGENEFEIDDITAADINLDELYKKINISCSQLGDEYLYRILRRPVLHEEILRERSRIADILNEDQALRLEIMARLKNMGRISGKGLGRTVQRLENVRRESNAIHYLCMFAALVAGVLIFVRPVIGFVAVIAVLFFNVITYFKRRGEIEEELKTFAYIFNCLYQAGFLMEIKERKGLEKYFDTISETVKSFRKLTSNSFILFAGRSLTGNLLSLPLDYIRIVFHPDLIKFNNSLKFVLENRASLFEMLDTVGFLDAAISIASFRQALGTWIGPEFSDEKLICFEGLDHPLIEAAVPYDVSTKKGLLITGSNASGKSTFLRAAALGIVLGETVCTVPALKARFPFSRIYSSMSVNDSLVKGDSLYMAEIRAVKRIIDAVGEDGPAGGQTVCFLDELLRGTNTIERIAAGSGILKELVEGGALCFAATHDTELTEILEGRLDNYHFSESIENERIRFTYRLEEGAAKTRNAIALLKMLGFDESITADAFEEAEKFEKTKVWSRI